jgi:hypothetical protein
VHHHARSAKAQLYPLLTIGHHALLHQHDLRTLPIVGQCDALVVAPLDPTVPQYQRPSIASPAVDAVIGSPRHHGMADVREPANYIQPIVVAVYEATDEATTTATTALPSSVVHRPPAMSTFVTRIVLVHWEFAEEAVSEDGVGFV